MEACCDCLSCSDLQRFMRWIRSVGTSWLIAWAVTPQRRSPDAKLFPCVAIEQDQFGDFVGFALLVGLRWRVEICNTKPSSSINPELLPGRVVTPSAPNTLAISKVPFVGYTVLWFLATLCHNDCTYSDEPSRNYTTLHYEASKAFFSFEKHGPKIEVNYSEQGRAKQYRHSPLHAIRTFPKR